MMVSVELSINIKCPKCGMVGLSKKYFGGGTEDYCYWCVQCKDQISKNGVLFV